MSNIGVKDLYDKVGRTKTHIIRIKTILSFLLYYSFPIKNLSYQIDQDQWNYYKKSMHIYFPGTGRYIDLFKEFFKKEEKAFRLIIKKWKSLKEDEQVCREFVQQQADYFKNIIKDYRMIFRSIPTAYYDNFWLQSNIGDFWSSCEEVFNDI